jgi:hypothetical protein
MFRITLNDKFRKLWYFDDIEDNTIPMKEGKQRNSRMPRGVFLRRLRGENPVAEALGTIFMILKGRMVVPDGERLCDGSRESAHG